MAYQTVRCDYCGKYLGQRHGYEVMGRIRRHFKKRHPAEWKEIKEASDKLNELGRKYSLSVRSIY